MNTWKRIIDENIEDEISLGCQQIGEGSKDVFFPFIWLGEKKILLRYIYVSISRKLITDFRDMLWGWKDYEEKKNMRQKKNR